MKKEHKDFIDSLSKEQLNAILNLVNVVKKIKGVEK